jgi:hypothetical protein
MNMRIENEIVINKSAPLLWGIVGEKFGSAHVWASGLNHSEGSGRKLSEQVCESRTCDIKGMGRIHERLLDFDPKRLTLKYEVVHGFPFFVERGVNRWTLTQEGDATRVHSLAEITTRGFVGSLMAPMLKMQMTGLMRRTLEDLKHYAETGRPHPRKLKALTSRKLART